MRRWTAIILLACALQIMPLDAVETAPTPTPAPAAKIEKDALPDHLAPLANALDNPDQEKRFTAFDELVKKAGAAAEAQYLRMLCDSDPLMRARAAQAIGKFKIIAGRPALEYLAATKEEPLWTRRQAVFALGKLADQHSHPVLLSLLTSETPELSSAAAEALAAFPTRATILGLISVLDDRHGQDLVRRAWHSLKYIGAPAFDAMFNFLLTAEPSRQTTCLFLLAELRNPGFMKALEKLLDSDEMSSTGKIAVLNIFVLYESIESIPATICALDDVNPAVAHEAHRTLVYLTGVCGEDSRSAWSALLGDSQNLKSLPEETRRMFENLSFPPFEDWKNMNREMLQNIPAETHFAVYLSAQGIGGLESFNVSQLDWHKWWSVNRETFLKERIRRLVELARSDFPVRRRAEAIRSLGLLKACDQFDLLWEFFRGEDNILSVEAQTALMEIGPSCLEKVGAGLARENLRVKQRVALLLGSFNDPRAVKILVAMLDGQRDLRVIHAACSSLQRLTGKSFSAPEEWCRWWRQESGQVKTP